jgi:hypothetical protein
MGSSKVGEEGVGTTLDPELARPRLLDSLVPEDTGIFLRVENGANAGTVFTLSSGGTYLMGREGARKHAEISLLGPDAYFLRDLASTNGTFVNGRRVTEKVSLRSEDRIRIGDTMLGFFVVEGAISSDATNGQRGAKIR